MTRAAVRRAAGSSPIDHLESRGIVHRAPGPGRIRLATRSAFRDEQVGRGRHDRRRTPVVDLESVNRRAGEEVAEPDQPFGCRAGVSVDRLIVVSDSKDLAGRSGQQAKQQHVGRCEVLELVDEQQAGVALGPMTKAGVGQQTVDGADDLLIEVGLLALIEQVPIADRHVVEADDIGQVADDILGMLETEANPAEGFDPRGDWIGLDLSRHVHQAGEQVPDV